MASWSGRLVHAPDVQSVARLGGRRGEKSKAPAATVVAVPVCEAGTRGLPTPHRIQTNEGADMAKRTRGTSPYDSGTHDSGVTIPPTRVVVPIPATPSVA